jgi:hypothetical protein
VSQTGTKGSLRAGTKASWAASRFWGDVAGPLVPAQMEAGTKGSRPKAHFPLVSRHGSNRTQSPYEWLRSMPCRISGTSGEYTVLGLRVASLSSISGRTKNTACRRPTPGYSRTARTVMRSLTQLLWCSLGFFGRWPLNTGPRPQGSVLPSPPSMTDFFRPPRTQHLRGRLLPSFA